MIKRHLDRLGTMRRGERGASLVMAMVFITSLAFMAMTTLDAGDSAARDDRAAQGELAAAYAGTGALDLYVNAMRSVVTWGREGSPCPSLSYESAAGGSVVVSCQPVHGSGAKIEGGAGAFTDRVVDLVAAVAGRSLATAQFEFVDGGGSTPGAVVKTRHWDSSR